MAEKTKTIQVAFRLPENLLERIDAYARRLSEAAPGLTITRADAARMLMTKALDAEESHGTARPKRR
jgi:hypothetical protein